MYARMEDPPPEDVVSHPTPPVAVQAPILQPGQPVVILQYGSSRTDLSRYNARAAIILGALQIISGICTIILNALGIVGYLHVTFIGYGIWGGILFILAGSFSLAAGRKKSFALMVTCMVMSIISAVAAGIVIITSAVGLTEIRWSYYRASRVPWILGVQTCMVLIGLLEFTVAITSSVLCCMPLCCQSPRQNGDIPAIPRVMYMPTNTQVQNGVQQLVTAAPGYQGPPPQNTSGIALQPGALSPSDAHPGKPLS